MIKKEEIKKLAELARIEVGEGEAAALAKDVDGIIAYVQQVQDISPVNGAADDGALVNVLRDDGEPHQSGAFTEALLAGVPAREGGYIKVKKIL